MHTDRRAREYAFSTRRRHDGTAVRGGTPDVLEASAAAQRLRGRGGRVVVPYLCLLRSAAVVVVATTHARQWTEQRSRSQYVSPSLSSRSTATGWGRRAVQSTSRTSPSFLFLCFFDIKLARHALRPSKLRRQVQELRLFLSRTISMKFLCCNGGLKLAILPRSMKHEKILKIHIDFNGQKLVIRGKKSWLLSVDRQTEREKGKTRAGRSALDHFSPSVQQVSASKRLWQSIDPSTNNQNAREIPFPWLAFDQSTRRPRPPPLYRGLGRYFRSRVRDRRKINFCCQDIVRWLCNLKICKIV
jgi:hypothetical protein